MRILALLSAITLWGASAAARLFLTVQLRERRRPCGFKTARQPVDFSCPAPGGLRAGIGLLRGPSVWDGVRVSGRARLTPASRRFSGGLARAARGVPLALHARYFPRPAGFRPGVRRFRLERAQLAQGGAWTSGRRRTVEEEEPVRRTGIGDRDRAEGSRAGACPPSRRPSHYGPPGLPAPPEKRPRRR
jgi:hypothetical protein